MSRFRTFALAAAVAASLVLVACGDDDDETGEGITTATSDVARYCELSKELDDVGREAFRSLEQDPNATAKDFAKVEAEFVEQVEPQLDEILDVAPEEIREEVQVLVASVRSRGGVEAEPVDEQEAAKAEEVVQTFETENCEGESAP